MSIYSALSSAVSGLTASSRAADIVSSNIANAMTEGYGTRRLETGTRTTGGMGAGVDVLGVRRETDPVAIAQRRGAEAQLGNRQVGAEFFNRLEQLLGAPDQPGSLSSRFSEFESALISASNSPWNSTLLSRAVDQAGSVASSLNELSAEIQDERLRADSRIGRSVDMINGALESLAELNKIMITTDPRSGEAASIQDQQAVLIDRIAPFMPLQTYRNENGTLRIYSADGHTLLDHKAATLEFTPIAAMDPYLDYADGDLSGITLNGRELTMDGPLPAFAGGELQALFNLRDTLAPEAQARLDSVARDLIERFDTPGLDPTVTAGNPGLFTDEGVLFVAANEIGLASRIQINSAVDDDAGGASWRLRDGVEAAAEGPPGNNTILLAQLDALNDLRPTASGGFSATQRSMSDLIAENLSFAGIARDTAEVSVASANARFSALEASELARGVDTDDELQRLLKIEQMYAANARVITVADSLLDELMRIGR